MTQRTCAFCGLPWITFVAGLGRVCRGCAETECWRIRAYETLRELADLLERGPDN